MNDLTIEEGGVKLGQNVIVGYCGVCCSHWGTQTRIPKIAKELKTNFDNIQFLEKRKLSK